MNAVGLSTQLYWETLEQRLDDNTRAVLQLLRLGYLSKLGP